jgi:hypothetical protein
MYTNEQLNAMTVDQLRAAIIALQGQQAGSAPAAIPTIAETPIQIDIENMKAAIAQFEAAGTKLFPDEFAAMKQKLANMETEAEAVAKTVETNVKTTAGKLTTIEQTFAQKYGQTIAHGIEIVLLAYIAGRLAGLL